MLCLNNFISHRFFTYCWLWKDLHLSMKLVWKRDACRCFVADNLLCLNCKYLGICTVNFTSVHCFFRPAVQLKYASVLLIEQLRRAKGPNSVWSFFSLCLVWDQAKLSLYNWLWYETTTFSPYVEETSYENSFLVQQSGSLALSSLTHVLRSLTLNAR